MKVFLSGRSIRQSVFLFFIGIPLLGIAALGVLANRENALYWKRFQKRGEYIFEQADKTLLATIWTILSKEADAINRSPLVQKAAEASTPEARLKVFQDLAAKWPELRFVEYWPHSADGEWGGKRYPGNMLMAPPQFTSLLMQSKIENGLVAIGHDKMLNLISPVTSANGTDTFVVLRFDASAMEEALQRAKNTVGTKRESLERQFADSIGETAFWQWGSAGALLLLLLFWAWYRAQKFLDPLRELEENAKKIASGNLQNITFQYRGHTDFSELVAAFEWMRKRILRFMHEVERRSAERAAWNRTLLLGRKIQEQLLPDKIPVVEELACAGKLLPARETSGDFYYLKKIASGKLFVAIGDVSGKGLSAALFMVRIQTLLEHLVRHISDPGEVLWLLNNEVAKRNPSNMFAAMQCALFDAKRGELLLANAGHLPPRIITRSGTVREVALNKTMVAGVFDFSDTNPYQSVRYPWDTGETWLFYTDGVTEATASDGKQFGADRLTSACAEMALSPEKMIEKIERARLAFIGNAVQSDDVTIVAVTRLEKEPEQ